MKKKQVKKEESVLGQLSAKKTSNLSKSQLKKVKGGHIGWDEVDIR